MNLMTAMLLFVGLIFLHCFADFIMQGSFLAIEKSNSFYLLMVHCILYTGTIMGIIALIFSELEATFIMQWILIIWFTHAIIDNWKIHAIKLKENIKSKTRQARLLYIDQACHYGVLLALFIHLVVIL